MIQFIRILSLIGVWLSGLSLYEHVAAKSGVSGSSLCKIGEAFDCAAVARSEWAEFLGFPTASLGLAVYTLIFCFGLIAQWKNVVPEKVFSSVMVLVSSLASLFSVFLFLISVFSVGKLCPMCISMYLVNFAMFYCAIRMARPTGLLSACLEGFSAFLRIPALILGIGTDSTLQQKSAARLGLLTGIVVLFFSSVAEGYIKKNMVVPQLADLKMLKLWEVQPAEELKTDFSGGAFGDYYTGDLNAKIKIVEYSDYECAGCRHLYKTLKPVIAKYKQNILFVHKNFPLDQACNSAITQKFHEHACYLSSLARCAGEQGKFWEAADIINNSQSLQKETTAEELRNEMDLGIDSLGLDKLALNDCVKSERQFEVIKKDVQQGLQLQLLGTPTLWVNGKRFEGRTTEEFEILFKHLLK